MNSDCSSLLDTGIAASFTESPLLLLPPQRNYPDDDGSQKSPPATMLVEKFSPEMLIAAPRRGPAVPNRDGSLALYTQSTHEIGGKTRSEMRVMNIETSNSWLLFEDDKAFDAAWVGDGTNTVIFLKKGDLGVTWVMSKDADRPADPPCILDAVPGPVSCLKLKRLDDGSVAFTVVGLVDTDGTLYNEELKKVPHSARVYDSYDVREVSELVLRIKKKIKK